MKILWLTNIPSPYRVDFFNELGKYCDLTVLFERGVSAERDKSWEHFTFYSFKGIFLKGVEIGVDKALCLEVTKHVKSDIYDHIIVSNFTTPTGFLAIEFMRLNNITYSLESDGGFPKTNSGIKELVKKHLIKGANIYFSTAKKHDEYYLRYGAKQGNIVRYPFTSIFDKEILRSPLTKLQKELLKNNLKIKEDKVILAVGQFIHRKGFDILLKACKDLNLKHGVYIVGGNPTEEYIQLKQELNLNNVHFIGFKKAHELQDYYKVADLFVLPTREDIWGLVINEAMAYGLPIITTDRCIAGLELVEDYKNGFIIPVDNSSYLAMRINEALNNEKMLEKMSQSNLDKIKDYTIESMVKAHINVFTNLLKGKS